MKKIININFQGRVIPIEESAYETLKQYVGSLRSYFANEEGRDEIINDIENRIAELFSERLKRGAACIADADINEIIGSIGRPQDFEAQSGESGMGGGYQEQSAYTQAPRYFANRGRLFRNEDDKIIGGVCSGLANYLGIDPVIMRVLFVILFGAFFWIYILLWIIVPSQSLETNITKRLYRNADDKVLAGVCGGLATYFRIDSWIPRLVFALPLIIGLISASMNAIWWNWNFGFGPRIITGSLSSTLFITYIILWIAVPYASTASEKLEMRGEKVDLNSIRDTVKEDLENFKSKAEKFGQEVKQSAQQFGSKASNFGQHAGTHARGFAADAAPMARRAGRGAGHVIRVLFRAFFLFIAGIIALVLFGVLIALIFGGMAAFPLKNFVMDSAGQNFLAWATLVLFLGVPLVGLITWLVRRIMGVRSNHNYLGYTFGILWAAGWFCVIFLVGSFANNFKVSVPVETTVNMTDPSSGKLTVDVNRSNLQYYHGDWFGFRFNEDLPVYGVNMDTLMLNTIRIKVVKSRDSSFHASLVKISQGSTRQRASGSAANIHFDIEQQDSMLYLPEGFPISSTEKFRNQKVLVIVQVPVGKRIVLKDPVNHYSWFDVNVNNRRGWNADFNDYRDESYSWDTGIEYIMTPDGLQKVRDLDPAELKSGRYRLVPKPRREENSNEEENNGREGNNADDGNNSNHYRYQQLEDSIRLKAKDKLREELRVKDSILREKKLKEILKSSTESRQAAPAPGNTRTLSLTGSILSPVLSVYQLGI